MGLLRNFTRNRLLLSKPYARLVAEWVDHEDVWSFQEVELEPRWLGSRYDFWHYLDGESNVPVESVSDICLWLTECDKRSDLELFRERDYWQHPTTFEQLRTGDCEDHALWAWRKLGELGIPAQFVIGRWQWKPESPSFHAWVTYEDDSGFHLLESMSVELEGMVRPLASAASDYVPHLSVGHRRMTRIYGGFIQYRIWKRKNRDKLWQGDIHRPLAKLD